MISKLRTAHNLTAVRLSNLAQIDSERGASMVEYALLIALLSIGVLGGLTAFGGGLGTEFSDISSEVERVSR